MSCVRFPQLRRGLSLVECILVMAIIAVLVALLIPAVQRSRVAAKRNQCTNNLKSLGLALQNYHDVHRVFPAGYYLAPEGPYTGWGWGIMILPYMDSKTNFNRFNFQNGLQNEYSNPELNPIAPSYLCPANTRSHRVQHLAVTTSGVRGGEIDSATVDAVDVFARSTYFGVAGYLPMKLGGIDRMDPGDSQANPGRLGNAGQTFSPAARYCDQQNFRGVFGQNSSVKLTDINDGISNVLMIGERYMPENASLGSVGHGTWLGVPDCSTSAGLAAALGDTSVRLNLGAKTRAETTGFGSDHTEGTHFLLVDGSVRLFSEKISITTYRDLSTIADGRSVSEF